MVKKKKIKSYMLLFIVFFIITVTGFILDYILVNKDADVISVLNEDSRVLYINELMSSNKLSYPDKDRNFNDWIELYNDADYDIDISEYTMSDKINQNIWSFPENTIIRAKSYIILFFSGDVKDGSYGEKKESFYVNIRIAKEGGEDIYLKDINGNIVDTVRTLPLEQDNVMRRLETNKWEISNRPTPGFSNDEIGYAEFIALFDNKDSPIKINEIMAQNSLSLTDEDGDYSDWIEIINQGKDTVNLNNYSISNNADNPFKWRFPNISLKGGEILLLFASGKDRPSVSGQQHLSFKLEQIGETLILSDNNGALIDEIEYSDMKDNSSYTKDINQNIFIMTENVTPGFTNNDEGAEEYYRVIDKNKNSLVINEVMVQNNTYLPQDGGRYFDWIEVKNISKEPINLKNYYLSTGNSNLYLWQFPEKILNPDELFIVMASGETELDTLNYTHANFKLNSTDEELYLSTSEGVADAVRLHNIPPSCSYGRNKNKSGFFYIENPTPQGENNDGKRYISGEPSVSADPGIYNNIDSLQVSLEAEGKMYYTLDGSIPTSESMLYKNALKLNSTAVLRVVSYEENKIKSNVLTCSYIINENHTIPVVSLVTDPKNLWDEATGIYAMGINATKEFPYYGANFWNDWEREGNITLYEEDKPGFSINCGIKMFGQSNRGYPKKSFQVKFKAEYGESYLRYPVFDTQPDITRYDSLVLRSGSQDYKRSMIRDELCTSIVAESMESLSVQAYKPCVLYLNGEYWGIYFIREKVDEDYISLHNNVSPESVSLLRGNSSVIYGSNDDYQSLIWYIEHNDLTIQSNYEYVLKKIDIDSYINYHIAQAYCGNRDTSNIKFYKSSENDGKWRWIFFDLDYGFYDDEHGLFYLIKPEGTGYLSKFSNVLIRGLLTNESFKELFLTQLGYHLKTTYSSDRVLAKINELYELLLPEMSRNLERWDLSMNNWKWDISVLKNYVTDGVVTRADYLINEAMVIFNLNEEDRLKYFA
ncbi:MAG: hypothetical protein K0S55_1516 [Clostridia bacterium]|nr:hypothetical protein [Clostridia bacterium]